MYDIAIIGAGTTGTCIARELAKYKLNIVLIEKDLDVANGITKANSAIIHAGYNVKPGTLKAKLNVASSPMFEQISEELDVPFKRIGALLIAFDDYGMEKVHDRYNRGQESGVPDLKILSREELLQLEPNLNQEVVGGLYAPTSGIICPWQLAIALAENAVENGVTLKLDSKVEAIEKNAQGYEISTAKEKIQAAYVINCAGLYADEVHDMVSAPAFRIIVKRGEYHVLDKCTGGLLTHTIFQAPKEDRKGVVITPTIEGNLLVGPSVEEIEDKADVNTTAEKLALLKETSKWTCEHIPFDKTIKVFAGMRPQLADMAAEYTEKKKENGKEKKEKDKDEFGDFLIEESKAAKGFMNVAGIKSPGISAAPAIAQYVVDMVKERLGGLQGNPHFNPLRKKIIRFHQLNTDQKAELIKKDPRYGNIVCRCQQITEGEIVESIHRTVGATTLDGVKKRVGSGMGRCQGGFCTPRIIKILARELNKDVQDIVKNDKGSYIVTGVMK